MTFTAVGEWPAPESVETALLYVSEFVETSAEWPAAESSGDGAPAAATSVDGVDVYDAGPTELTLVSWAMARFECGGLPTPPVGEVAFELPTPLNRSEVCVEGTTVGLAYVDDDSMGHVALRVSCDGRASPLPIEARRTILHEFAHIWNAHHLEAEGQQALMALFDVDSWNGPFLSEESGNEYTAEVLVWGLMDELVLPHIPGVMCADLADAFSLLTGRPPTSRLADCSERAMYRSPYG